MTDYERQLEEYQKTEYEKGAEMSRYNVCAMIPYGLDVEADSPEEAVEEFFRQGGAELANYGGDGIHITNLDTGEETDE